MVAEGNMRGSGQREPLSLRIPPSVPIFTGSCWMQRIVYKRTLEWQKKRHQWSDDGSQLHVHLSPILFKALRETIKGSRHMRYAHIERCYASWFRTSIRPLFCSPSPSTVSPEPPERNSSGAEQFQCRSSSIKLS